MSSRQPAFSSRTPRLDRSAPSARANLRRSRGTTDATLARPRPMPGPGTEAARPATAGAGTAKVLRLHRVRRSGAATKPASDTAGTPAAAGTPSAYPPDAAWDRFVARYGGRLEARLRANLRRLAMPHDPDLVEELAQEVYCRLLERRRCYARRLRTAGAHQVRSYVGRVADNVVRDHLRSWRAAKRGGGMVPVPLADLSCDRLAPLVSPGTSLSASLPSAESRLLARERRRLLVERLVELLAGTTSPRDIRILLLAVVRGWTSAEISKRTGLSPTAVDSVVHRVRRRLAAVGIELPSRCEL